MVPKQPTKKVTKKAVQKTRPHKVSRSSIEVIDTKGKVVGHFVLPKEMRETKVSQQLLAQAMRVYLANQRQGTASTKTRGEVAYSTRKIYKQKGTGRARHGSIKAPIFVGGGIVFGPRPRDFSLKLPVKMKKRALLGALSHKAAEGKIKVVEGLTKIKPKTRTVVTMLEAFNQKERSTLIAVAADAQRVIVAARNIPYVTVIPARQLTAYDAMTNEYILFAREALGVLNE